VGQEWTPVVDQAFNPLYIDFNLAQEKLDVLKSLGKNYYKLFESKLGSVWRRQLLSAASIHFKLKTDLRPSRIDGSDRLPSLYPGSVGGSRLVRF